jgi:rhodanese-related sulfurtransferase
MWPFSRSSSGGAVATVDVREAFDRQSKGARIIDVRTPQEFRAGHPKGARNISPQQIKGDSTGLKKDDEVLVICASGHRSARAAHQLAGMGFANVSNVAGGLQAWAGAGLPVKK